MPKPIREFEMIIRYNLSIQNQQFSFEEKSLRLKNISNSSHKQDFKWQIQIKYETAKHFIGQNLCPIDSIIQQTFLSLLSETNC